MADAKPQQAGRKSLLFAGDIGDEGTCRELVEAVVKQFGRIDILVNNAAFQGKSVESFEALTGEQVDSAPTSSRCSTSRGWRCLT